MDQCAERGREGEGGGEGSASPENSRVRCAEGIYHYTREWCLEVALLVVFLPARRYASAGYRDRNVSVCPSVTRRYCVKTKKASGMISSPSGRAKTLVFRRQISSPNSKGFPPNGASNKGRSEKFRDLLAVTSVSRVRGTNQSQSQSLHCYII